MFEHKLDLLQLASSLVTEPGAGSTEIMRRDHSKATISSSFANDGPDHLRGESTTLNDSGFPDGAKERAAF